MTHEQIAKANELVDIIDWADSVVEHFENDREMTIRFKVGRNHEEFGCPKPLKEVVRKWAEEQKRTAEKELEAM